MADKKTKTIRKKKTFIPFATKGITTRDILTQPSKGCQGFRSRVGAAQGWGTEVHAPSTWGRKQSPLVWRYTEKHSTRS